MFHELPYVSHPSSCFLWLALPEDARADRIAATLAEQHLSVSTAELLITTTRRKRAILLALGATDLQRLPTTLWQARDVIVDDCDP